MTDCDECGYPNPGSGHVVVCRNCGAELPAKSHGGAAAASSVGGVANLGSSVAASIGRHRYRWGVGLVVVGSLMSVLGIVAVSIFLFRALVGDSSSTVSEVGAAIRVPLGEYEAANDSGCLANITEARIVVWHDFLTSDFDTVNVDLGVGTIDGTFCQIEVGTPPVAVSHIVDLEFGECTWRLSNDPESVHSQYALSSNPNGPASIDLGTFTYPFCS